MHGEKLEVMVLLCIQCAGFASPRKRRRRRKKEHIPASDGNKDVEKFIFIGKNSKCEFVLSVNRK